MIPERRNGKSHGAAGHLEGILSVPMQPQDFHAGFSTGVIRMGKAVQKRAKPLEEDRLLLVPHAA